MPFLSPGSQRGCNGHSQTFPMRSARKDPKSCRACDPPAAAQTRTGRDGRTAHSRRCPSYTADKVRRVCEMKLITCLPSENKVVGKM